LNKFALTVVQITLANYAILMCGYSWQHRGVLHGPKWDSRQNYLVRA